MSKKQKADLDDGYTRIANSILEAIISGDFTLRETKVLLFIMRNTFGYNRKEHLLSHRYIAEGTGISYSKIAAVINSLQKKNAIHRVAAQGSRPQKISINTHLDEWSFLPQNGVPQKGVDTPNWSTPKGGSISYPKTEYARLPQNGVPTNTVNTELKKECVGAAQAPPPHTSVFERCADEWKYSVCGVNKVSRAVRDSFSQNGYMRLTDARLRYEDDFENRTTKNNQPMGFRSWAEGGYKQYLPPVNENGVWYNIRGQKCKGEVVFE